MRIYIYIIVYTDRALADCFSRVGLLRRAVPCRGLCGLPRSAPRRLRLPKQHARCVHPRDAATNRRRTAAAMRPVASETRGTRAATAQILAVLKSWQKPSSTYTASPTRRWSPACSIRGPAARSEDAPRVTPQHARISVRCSDPSGSSGGSSRQEVLSGSTGGPSAASRVAFVGEMPVAELLLTELSQFLGVWSGEGGGFGLGGSGGLLKSLWWGGRTGKTRPPLEEARSELGLVEVGQRTCVSCGIGCGESPAISMSRLGIATIAGWI